MSAIRRPGHLMYVLDLAGRRAWRNWMILRQHSEHARCRPTNFRAGYPHLTEPTARTLHVGLLSLQVRDTAAVGRNRHYCGAWDCTGRSEWLECSTGGIEDPGFA